MAKFTEIFADETKRGYKIPTSEYLSSGKFPIIDQGQGQIAGYTDLESGVFTDVPAIIFGDHTRIIKYVDTPFFLGADGVKVLKAKVPDVDYKYLFYCLQNAKIPNTGYNRHFKWLKEIEIPLVSLDEQRHIAAVLEKVTDLIAQRRAQLDKLDLMIKSRFVEMFGDCNYPHKPLIDLIVEGAGLSYGIVQPGNDGTGDMGVIRPVDLVDGKISMESIKHIDQSIGDAFKKTELTGDELLITVRGTTGITALSNRDCKGMNVTRGIAVIRYDRNKINPVYLNAYLNAGESQNYIQEHTRGATLQQINLSDLRILQILVPPMSQQKQLENFVNNMTKLKETIASSLNMLEVLKSSFMQKYFE